MSLALKHTEFYEKLNYQDSPAYIYLEDERLKKDVWLISETLPHLTKEAHIALFMSPKYRVLSFRQEAGGRGQEGIL